MKRLLAVTALAAGISTAALGAGRAQAEPMCQFLGANYDVQYPCTEYQPWLPWGTGNNPPLGGSAVIPGGNGPSGGYHWQPKSPACPACSS